MTSTEGFADPTIGTSSSSFLSASSVSRAFLLMGVRMAPGATAFNADSVGSDLLREGLHEHSHSAVGRGVIDMACPRDALVHTAHRDDEAGGSERTAGAVCARNLRTALRQQRN
jgi:hypothetical protein